MIGLQPSFYLLLCFVYASVCYTFPHDLHLYCDISQYRLLWFLLNPLSDAQPTTSLNIRIHFSACYPWWCAGMFSNKQFPVEELSPFSNLTRLTLCPWKQFNFNLLCLILCEIRSQSQKAIYRFYPTAETKDSSLIIKYQLISKSFEKKWNSVEISV